MFRVLLERGAEKDLARLSSEIHDRVIAAIQALARNLRPPGCRKLADRPAAVWVARRRRPLTQAVLALPLRI